jgi:hypothetical protein
MAEEKKERKKASWKLEGSVLTVTYADESKAIFDLRELHEEFILLSETARETMAYGVKQKLSDSCARPKGETLTPALMKKVMNTTFEEVVSGEAWTRKTGEKDLTKAKKWISEEMLETMAASLNTTAQHLEELLKASNTFVKRAEESETKNEEQE